MKFISVCVREDNLLINCVGSIFSKLANIVHELIDNEKTYIEKLTQGIKIYVEPLFSKNLPPSLRGQVYNIFANIVQIRDFHEKTFYPSLLACNGDVEALSDTFSLIITVSLHSVLRIE